MLDVLKSKPRLHFENRQHPSTLKALKKWIGRRVYLNSPNVFLVMRQQYLRKKSPFIFRPETFYEKILWSKAFQKHALQKICTDKLAVRDYVADRVGSDVLIPLLAKFCSAEEIDFQKIPANAFVMKCNHDSGSVVVVHDAKRHDVEDVKSFFAQKLASNYFTVNFEPQYKHIKPMVMVEELLLDEVVGDLLDFKFYCFDGKVEMIHVDQGRFSNPVRDFYSRDWRHLEIESIYPRSAAFMPKPSQLERMIEIAEKLADPFHFARIDLYHLSDGRILFGEVTFHPNAGASTIQPRSEDLRLGRKLSLRALRRVVRH